MEHRIRVIETLTREVIMGVEADSYEEAVELILLNEGVDFCEEIHDTENVFKLEIAS